MSKTYKIILNMIFLLIMIFNHSFTMNISLFQNQKIESEILISNLSKDNDFKTVVQGINKFSFDLYKNLIKNEDNKEKNLFYSPTSLSIAFAMTYIGSRKNTEKQISNVLNFNIPQENLHQAYSKLLKYLKSNKGYELNIANALWLQKDYQFLPEFLNIINKNYKGGLNLVDFKNEPEVVRNKINNWIYKETKSKINNILNQGDITEITRLVLANAIYFKGKWKYEFDEDDTKERDFFLINGKTIKVNMMFKAKIFKYFENNKLQLLDLPYNDEKASMIIVLPKNNSNFNEVENLIDEKNLENWINNSNFEHVMVYIPRFKFSLKLELNTILSNMGIKDAFDEFKADFSGINGNNDLRIDKVIHKGFVEVNEKGTEATAATVIVMGLKSAIEPEYKLFLANHPFIFIIRDNITGCILFIGRVMNPNDEGEI